MKTTKKRRTAANTQSQEASTRDALHRFSCINNACGSSSVGRLLAFLIVAIFVLGFGFFVYAVSFHVGDKVSAVAVDEHTEFYDIVLGDDEPQSSVKRRAQKVVPKPVQKAEIPAKSAPVPATPKPVAAAPKPVDEAPKKAKEQEPLFKVQVQEEEEDTEATAQAEDNAAIAQRYLRKDDLEQAIQYQRKATESLPQNMLYKLKLAIMLDRHAEAVAAVALYREVLKAAKAQDKTLPAKLDVNEIRLRVEFLEAVIARK